MTDMFQFDYGFGGYSYESNEDLIPVVYISKESF